MSSAPAWDDWARQPKRFSRDEKPSRIPTFEDMLAGFDLSLHAKDTSGVLTYQKTAPYPFLESRGMFIARRQSAAGEMFSIFAFSKRKIGRNAGARCQLLDLSTGAAGAFERLFQAAAHTASDEMDHIGRDGTWIHAALCGDSPVFFKAWSPGESSLPGQFCATMSKVIKGVLVSEAARFDAAPHMSEIERLAESFEGMGPA